MRLFEIIQHGGFIMYPLLFCSVLIWAVVMEKFYSLSRFSKQNRDFFSQAQVMMKNGQYEQVKGLYSSAQDLIARPYLTLLEERTSSKTLREEKVYRRLLESQAGLRRFMWILGTIGSSAPFIGLFGTVVGIIRAFDDISLAGKSGFSVVAGSLSEALIATAAGILVAVIAVVFYNFFQTRLQQVGLEFKHSIEDLADHFN